MTRAQLISFVAIPAVLAACLDQSDRSAVDQSTSRALPETHLQFAPVRIGDRFEYERSDDSGEIRTLSIRVAEMETTEDAFGDLRSLLRVDMQDPKWNGSLWVDPASRLVLKYDWWGPVGAQPSQVFQFSDYSSYVWDLFFGSHPYALAFLVAGQNFRAANWTNATVFDGVIALRAVDVGNGTIGLDFKFNQLHGPTRAARTREGTLDFAHDGPFPISFSEIMTHLSNARLVGDDPGTEEITLGTETDLGYPSRHPEAPPIRFGDDPVIDAPGLAMTLRSALSIARATGTYQQFAAQNPGLFLGYAGYHPRGEDGIGLAQWDIQFLTAKGESIHDLTVRHHDAKVRGQDTIGGPVGTVVAEGHLFDPVPAVFDQRYLASVGRANVSFATKKALDQWGDDTGIVYLENLINGNWRNPAEALLTVFNVATNETITYSAVNGQIVSIRE